MKYWIFQNNQVLGPYAPDDLGRHAAFDAETLVCPEGRRGTSMGDWQRAATVPELSSALAKPASVATLPTPSPQPAPETSAALDAFQEKLERLGEDLQNIHLALDGKASTADVADVVGELKLLRAQLAERPLTPSPEPETPAETLSLSLSAPIPEPAPITFETVVPPPLEALASPEPEAAAPSTVAPKSGKKKLLIGGFVGLLALGLLLIVASRSPETPPPPEAVTTPSAPPAPEQAAPAEPPPAPDSRTAAIEIAKQWPLPDGKVLGQALETLSPPNGNLSPWMAEPLPNNHASVNYFARGGGAGAPTVAYEFVIDLETRSVAGRNSAAKSVLAGRSTAPQAPPKAKPVKLRAKKKVKPAQRAGKAADEAALDNLLRND